MRYLFCLVALLLCCNLLKAQTAPCPPNLDFEQGNYANWEFFTGTCCPLTTPVQTSGPVAGRHEITTGTAVDPYGLFPVVDPIGGVHSFKLGNSMVGRQAERARYYVHVPTGIGRYVLSYRYAVVFENPPHDEWEQPRFLVNVYDSVTNSSLPCAQFTFVADTGLSGFFLSTLKPDVYYRPWTTGSIDLSHYQGRTIGLEFTSGDCNQGGHFGYGYIDMNCGIFETYKVLCSNTSGTQVLEGPPGFEFYEWHDSLFTTHFGSGKNVTVPTPTVTTTYAIVVRPYNGFGCPDTFYTRVEVFDYKTTNYTIICGSEVNLNVQIDVSDAPYTYFWQPATGLSCNTCASPVASPLETTDYIVTVKGKSGCEKTDTMSLVVNNILRAQIAPVPDTFCQFDSVQLNDLSVNPPGTDVKWFIYSGDITSGKDSKNATGLLTMEGQQIVVLENHKDGCSAADTAIVTVKSSPIPAFSITDHACLGDSLKLIPKDMGPDATYYWSIDGWDIKDTYYQNPIRLSWNTLGKKNIGLQVAYKNGCKPVQISSAAHIHEFPFADVSVMDQSVCLNDTINLGTLEAQGYLYEWTPVRAFVRNDLSQVKAIVDRDQFLAVKTSNIWGCSVADSIYIRPIHCCDISFADAFTPNGDGINDKFRVLSGGFQTIESFMIKNRWGQTIFQTTNQSDGWDGKFKGVPQDPGTYMYYIKYKCSDEEAFEKKGSFILLR